MQWISRVGDGVPLRAMTLMALGSMCNMPIAASVVPVLTASSRRKFAHPFDDEVPARALIVRHRDPGPPAQVGIDARSRTSEPSCRNNGDGGREVIIDCLHECLTQPAQLPDLMGEMIFQGAVYFGSKYRCPVQRSCVLDSVHERMVRALRSPKRPSAVTKSLLIPSCSAACSRGTASGTASCARARLFPRHWHLVLQSHRSIHRGRGLAWPPSAN